jgi:RecA-family ATPase
MRILCLNADLLLDDQQLKNYTLAEIERLLRSHGKSMKEDYPTMPKTDISMIHESRNRLIYDEMNYNQQVLEEEHNRLMSTMTAEQRGVYDTIMTRVDANLPGIFFLYGYGGTGKTFIWRSLSSALRSKKEIVLTVASSGIAALLIPGGRTAHSRFGIPIIVDEISTCGIHPKSPLAELV